MAKSSRELLSELLQDEQARSAEKDQIIAERDAKIAALEAQVRELEANSGRLVRRQDPTTVKELPVLQADPATGRAVCPTNAEHGSISPNVRGLCPKCYTEAVKASAMARREAASA